jgi:hypothetical protein
MKPLFDKNFLSNFLSDFQLSSLTNIRLAKSIIDSFIQELKSGKLESLKEEEIKSRFLNEFFGDVLGFNYGNSTFWTLREEAKTKVDGTKPDGVLGFFTKNKESDDVRAVIELKNASTDLDKKQKRKDSKCPVSQAFEYSQKFGENCKWVIVSNLKEIRFYTSSFVGKYQVFFLEELSNEDKLKELLFLFHKDRMVNRSKISSTEKLYKLSLKTKKEHKPRHIVEEIYFSLNRFKGLNFVDPNYLANIKPFNIVDDNVWHYSNGNLLSINPAIYLLFQNLSFEKGLVIISPELEKELKEAKVIEYQDKIEWFVKFLNHSQIVEISCVENYEIIIAKRSNGIGFSHKHKFYFSEKEGITKSINILDYKPCDCISCNFKSFNFNNLLGKLKTSMFKEENLNLEYGYGNYLVSSNNYKNAFNIYKKISEKTKGVEGKEIEYFLAKLNMKSLHSLVWEDERLEDSYEIRQEAKNIDLNKIYTKKLNTV